MADHTGKFVETFARMGKSEVAIAVLATKVTLYSIFGGAIAGTVVALLFELLRK